MTQDIPVPYDSEFQSPIPNIWRDTIVQIVEAFKNKDFARLNTIPNIEFIDIEYAAEIAENIDDYGAHLISLPAYQLTSLPAYQLTRGIMEFICMRISR